MKFTSTISGSITAIKFYKGAGNPGAHTGALWNAAGQRLATATFTNESLRDGRLRSSTLP